MHLLMHLSAKIRLYIANSRIQYSDRLPSCISKSPITYHNPTLLPATILEFLHAICFCSFDYQISFVFFSIWFTRFRLYVANTEIQYGFLIIPIAFILLFYCSSNRQIWFVFYDNYLLAIVWVYVASYEFYMAASHNLWFSKLPITFNQLYLESPILICFRHYFICSSLICTLQILTLKQGDNVSF